MTCVILSRLKLSRRRTLFVSILLGIFVLVCFRFFFNTITTTTDDVVFNYYETNTSPSSFLSLTTFKEDMSDLWCSRLDLKSLERKTQLGCSDVSKYIDASSGKPINLDSFSHIGAGYFRDAYLLNGSNFHPRPFVFKVNKVDSRRNRLRHKQEGRLLSLIQLQTPYIVQHLGRCKTTIMSEYLHRRLEDEVLNSTLSELRKARIIHDVVAGVEVLHGNLIAHTDIQVDQFLVREDGTVALNDLNRARVLSIDGKGGRCGFRVELSVGKWRSPEELLQHQRLTYKVDIFSMGLVFWTVLTGQLPFARLSASQAKAAVLAGGRPPLPSSKCRSPLEALLCKLIRQAWASDPNKRPEAHMVRHQLAAALNLSANK